MGMIFLAICVTCQLCRFFHICFTSAFAKRYLRHAGALVGRIFNRFSHTHWAREEAQCVVGAGVRWKPVMPVDLLAIGNEFRMQIGALTPLFRNLIGPLLSHLSTISTSAAPIP